MNLLRFLLKEGLQRFEMAFGVSNKLVFQRNIFGSAGLRVAWKALWQNNGPETEYKRLKFIYYPFYLLCIFNVFLFIITFLFN